jgi:hypothetical protein
MRPLHTAASKSSFADDALAVPDRIFEEVKNLRLEGDQDPVTPQLAPRRIQ